MTRVSPLALGRPPHPALRRGPETSRLSTTPNPKARRRFAARRPTGVGAVTRRSPHETSPPCKPWQPCRGRKHFAGGRPAKSRPRARRSPRFDSTHRFEFACGRPPSGLFLDDDQQVLRDWNSKRRSARKGGGGGAGLSGEEGGREKRDHKKGARKELRGTKKERDALGAQMISCFFDRTRTFFSSFCAGRRRQAEKEAGPVVSLASSSRRIPAREGEWVLADASQPLPGGERTTKKAKAALGGPASGPRSATSR